MPFVVPGQQQPQQEQQRSGRGGGMERRDYASQQPGPGYRQPQQQRDPWQQQRQQMQQPYRYQPAPQPQGQYRGPQRSQGGYGGYQPARMPNPYQPRPYAQQQRQYMQPMQDQYAAQSRRGYEQGGRQQMTRPMEYSNRPQQGTYVGEGVYADGTPMPPVSSSGYNGQSLIQSNSGPASGVYAGFAPTPDVNGGDIVPRPYFEEEDTYNKPMRVGRGGGGID